MHCNKLNRGAYIETLILNGFTCNSCNMGTRDLPDMYAQSPRAEGIHIRQITRAHVTSNMYHF